jgi:hypothetical protein
LNKSLLAPTVAITLLLAFSGANIAFADSSSHSYDYLVGTGFLCAIYPGACPDITMASNGDTISVTGSGSFTTHPDSVSGGGTFTHTSSQGVVLATGTWTATKLMSFISYGPGFAPDPTLYAGKAVIAVNLYVGSTLVHTGVMTIICMLDEPIPPGHHEGIHLNVQDGINFNKQVDGITVFIRTA